MGFLEVFSLFFFTFVCAAVFLTECKVKETQATHQNFGQTRNGENVDALQSCTSPSALGMESGLIPNRALSASSWLYYQTDFYGPQAARLNLSPYGPWVKHNNDQNPWIQVDLEGIGVVTGLKTQGGSGPDKTVTAFKVQTGTTECGMDYIRDQNGNVKVFSISYTLNTINFAQAVSARFIRIEPSQWSEYCALRFEVVGCLDLPRCPTGWDKFDNQCYLFDHDSRLTYDQAKSSCTNNGAQLVIIQNQEEQDFLAGKIQSSSRHWHGYFIGLDDIATEGTFTWLDGTSLSFSAWNPGEPSNYGSGEDCVGLWPNGAGKWNDYPCGGTYAYVCEKPIVSTAFSTVNKDQQNHEKQQRAVCTSPVRMGMETGQLGTSKISVSTVWFNDINGHGPQATRLNIDRRWVAHHSDNYPWVQVDLHGVSNTVTGVITQGSPSNDEWVESFKVRTGTQECNLQYILGSDNKPLVFNGNTDRNTELTNNFPQPVTARFVRIEPTQWKVTCSLRFEVLGCITGTTLPSCDGEWKAFGSHCYLFADTAKLSFSGSQTACQNMGAKLASVHSQDEADFIGLQTKHDGTSSSWWGYWIGFTDQVTENMFVWTDGTTADYTNWYPGEPNNWHEDCAAVVQKKNDQWNDAACDTLYAYVCKKQG